jgi:hypothetical protein
MTSNLQRSTWMDGERITLEVVLRPQALVSVNKFWQLYLIIFLTHWSWLRIEPFTWSGNRAHGGYDWSTVDFYSS